MTDTDANPFYSTPLGQCILAGDITGVMDTVDSMGLPERTAALVGVQALLIDRWKLVRKPPAKAGATTQEYDYGHANRLFRAVELARFMCASDTPREDYWMHIGIQDVAAFRQRYRPALSGQALEKQLRGAYDWHYRRHIHRAVVAGLLPRPDTEEYVESLFFGDLRQESNVILKHIDADPALAPFFLALFEREGASDTSFAAVEKYCHDPALHWSTAFLTLCERGVYTRTELLDKTLGALSCDWPQFKSGWFSRFHGMLAPTVDEMSAFAPSYLALCHSRIAPSVSMAMDAVTALYQAGALAEAPVCDTLQAVVSSAVKGRVLSALELLGQIVKKDRGHATRASGLAVLALAHSAADVQKKAIACLTTWGLDAQGQEAASTYLPLVAAVNQPPLRALLGPAPMVAPRPAKLPPVTAKPPEASTPARESPLDPSRALVPLMQVPDLIEHLAYVFENPTDVDAWERGAEALVRMAPLPPETHTAFGALKKRGKAFKPNDKPLSHALAQLLATALGDNVDATAIAANPAGLTRTADVIALHANSLALQASQGLGLSPLSAPTHRGGFIDPQQLRKRQAAFQRAGVAPSALEQELALMRVVPDSGMADTFAGKLNWSVSSSDGEYVVHRLQICAEPPLRPQVPAGLRALLTAKHLTLGRWQTEGDRACIRFAASLLPNDLEPFFAEGAHALGNNLDWWEATWQNRAYLDLLLAPTTPMTPMACLMLALALAGKEPGQTALAVDALTNSLQSGRLLPQVMSETLAAVWATPLVKGTRLAKSLTAAAQAHTALPDAVYQSLCAMVVVNPEAPRIDSAPLLELMLELQLAQGMTLPPDTRTTLTRMRLTGKSKAAQVALLG